jgi:hypothetical protein
MVAVAALSVLAFAGCAELFGPTQAELDERAAHRKQKEAEKAAVLKHRAAERAVYLAGRPEEIRAAALEGRIALGMTPADVHAALDQRRDATGIWIEMCRRGERLEAGRHLSMFRRCLGTCERCDEGIDVSFENDVIVSIQAGVVDRLPVAPASM